MLTLLRFHATWCGPCKALEPTMDQLKIELKDYVKFADIDIESNPQLRVDYGIRSIPAIVLTEDGKEVARRTGGASYTDLLDWINEHRAS